MPNDTIITNQPPAPSRSPFNPMMLLGGLIILAMLAGGYVMSQRGDLSSSQKASPSPTTQVIIDDTTDEMMQDDSQEPNTTATPGTATGDEASGTSELAQEARVIEVEAGGFYYAPSEIRVQKGERVRIVMNSVDMMHDFVIDELDVKMPITRSGETNEIEFTAQEAGTFEYYCSVGEHRQNGQVGTLIVEE